MINSPIEPRIAWSGLCLDVGSLGQVLDGLSVVVALETHHVFRVSLDFNFDQILNFVPL